MKTIIVDDEPLALRRVENLLEEQIESGFAIELIGSFQDPQMALDFARREKVDLVFQDIEMPEIGGMELAERLLEIQPQLHIVFITAYNDFAVEAFELNALDYLLKPVQRDRIFKTLQRLFIADPKEQPDNGSKQQRMLCSLFYLHYLDENQMPQTFQWRTTKAQELFAYLIHNRGQTVRKETIMDLLWPDYDMEKASSLLHTTIYQIRRVIKQKGLCIQVKYMEEGYRIDLADMKLDVEEWEKGVHTASAVTAETIGQHRKLLALYRGDYLAEHLYLWSEGEQERIRLIWLEHAKQVAEYFIQMEQYSEAVPLYQKIQGKFPYTEEGYFGLMRIYAKIGDYGGVRNQYQLLVENMKEELGVEPSANVIDWYEQWRSRI
ncbi:response regulator [Paenibacillus sp. J2TS4]|uniref:response regulator n=1 Tax=Paenibacillus sp. J2TS4 TaxID=2807194 RepID=UPI001B1BE662|nr:response regulator [Paenibacillus sp. J2TS4]GIP33749.1 DNA-binding response regulator [Paenibacillus sp. J2TS4]